MNQFRGSCFFLDIFHFLKVKFNFYGKYVTKKIREIDLFDFTSFFRLDFFKIFWPAMQNYSMELVIYFLGIFFFYLFESVP